MPPPKLEKPKYEVLRDTREKEGKGWLFDPSTSCLGTSVVTLDTGDYSIRGAYENKLFVIERKGSVSELVGNLTNKEKWAAFQAELARLDEFTHPFVVCEFPLSLIRCFPKGSGVPVRARGRFRISPQFLLMRLEEIWLRHKARWVFADGDGLGKEIASGLFKRLLPLLLNAQTKEAEDGRPPGPDPRVGRAVPD